MAPIQAHDVTSEFSIPTIDLTAYLSGGAGSDELESIVNQLRTACSTSGFFQIVGHGISQEMQNAVLSASETLFSLPQEEKLKLKGRPGLGYETIGSQVLEAGKKADLKEGFFFNREILGLQPPYKAHREPNIWPDTTLLPEAEFKTPLLKYHTALSQLAVHLMGLLAKGLSFGGDSIMTDFCREPIAGIKLLHYPPHPDFEDDLLVGAGAHTDFGAITILLTDGNPGLQVLNQAKKEWVDVPPRDDAFVVNVGDLLDTWTSGNYKSTIHRVINTSGQQRYSVPFFFDGNPDFLVQPLDGSAGEKYTVLEHLMLRYGQSY